MNTESSKGRVVDENTLFLSLTLGPSAFKCEAIQLHSTLRLHPLSLLLLLLLLLLPLLLLLLLLLPHTLMRLYFLLISAGAGNETDTVHLKYSRFAFSSLVS